MMRRTKIVATLGPASSNPDILGQMIEAGVDVVRINLRRQITDDNFIRKFFFDFQILIAKTCADLQKEMVKVQSMISFFSFAFLFTYLESGMKSLMTPKNGHSNMISS